MHPVASTSIRPPIPLDLRRELPEPLIPWKISERLFQRMQAQGTSIAYKKVQVLPTDPEWRFIWRYFYWDKPTKYGIKQIHCVHERRQMSLFESNFSSIEREASKFSANWDQEPRADQRAVAIDRWKQTTQVFSPLETTEEDGRKQRWVETKVLPLWHGSSEQVCNSICGSGFIYFGKTSLGATNPGDPKSTDEGFFGSGIYFTDSARYASDIYSKGHILLGWVSMREPFPVVGDPEQLDMNTFRGKGAYKSYNAHYVPVVPIKPYPNCAIYYPCQKEETPNCDEIVVFHKSQALPRFWVELDVEPPYLITPSKVPEFVKELIPHIFKILQNVHVDQDKKLRNILCTELAVLLTLSGTDKLEENDKFFFDQITQLIDNAGQLNKEVRANLIENFLKTKLSDALKSEDTRAVQLLLERNPLDTTIDLNRIELKDAGVETLAQVLMSVAFITELDLTKNEITEEGAQKIGRLLECHPSLKTLVLTKNNIGILGAQAIAQGLRKSKILTCLNLGANELTDEAGALILDALKDNTTLESLDLGANALGKETVKKLIEVLKTNSKLSVLHLWGNSIEDSAVDDLIDALKHNKILTHCYLHGNSIREEKKQLFAALQKEKPSLKISI
jgi:hypothetical protein